METVAIYWEPLIKTYGLSERRGLCLVSFRIASGGSEWSWNPIDRYPDQASPVWLVIAQPGRGDYLNIHLLLNDKPGNAKMAAILDGTDGAVDSLRISSPVDVVYFQGPHYGDRYGIADTAFHALALKHVPVLVASCCGSSIYIVVPAGNARPAVEALSDKFVAPGAPRKAKTNHEPKPLQ